MLEYHRIDLSEGIDINKTDSSCECIIYHYWYFLKINVRFKLKVCGFCFNMTKNEAVDRIHGFRVSVPVCKMHGCY